MYEFISSKGIDPKQEFDLIELIGQGNYGRVYKVLHKKTGKIYAAKISNKVTNNKIWIILEYCDGRSLLELINIFPKVLNEEQIASLIYMI